MMKKIIGLLLLLPLFAHAQSTGIQFESGLDWKQIQAKAKTENKYIFVDCYATWCEPCKWMSNYIFSDREAGNYMNAHFINVAVQMDRTGSDNQAVKDWYADALMLRNLYKVGVYPTYLVFSPDGIPLHCFNGSRESVKAFLAAVNESFDPTKQYYGLIKQWKSHKSDTAYLFNLYSAVLQQRDEALTDSIGEAYLDGQTDLFTMKNLRLIGACHLIRASNDKWFRFFLNNAAKINAIVDDSTAVAEKLSDVVFKEEITPFYFDGKPLYWNVTKENIRKKYPTLGQALIDVIQERIEGHMQGEISTIIRVDKNEPDWGKVTKTMEQKYPDSNLELSLANFKLRYYADKNMWAESAEAACLLITKYRDHLSDGRLNSISWDNVFMHTSSPKILSAAGKAMSNMLKNNFNPIYVDTYANILYKLGKHDEALTWENKAIETSVKNGSDPRDLKDFKINLEKMQQNQPTWEN